MAASTTPQSVFGFQLSWGGHDVGYLVDANYSGMTIEMKDAHSQESAYKEKLAGMIDSGEVNMTLRFIPGDSTGQKQMYTDAKARVEREVIITYPDTTTWTFDALVSKIGDYTLNEDDTADFSVTLKVNGEPTHSDLD